MDTADLGPRYGTEQREKTKIKSTIKKITERSDVDFFLSDLGGGEMTRSLSQATD